MNAAVLTAMMTDTGFGWGGDGNILQRRIEAVVGAGTR